MQIVIDIPDDFKDYIEDVLMGVGDATGILVDAVMIGKPLPKGHGRLIDADELLDSLDKMAWIDGQPRAIRRCIRRIEKEPTIIEASEGGRE